MTSNKQLPPLTEIRQQIEELRHTSQHPAVSMLLLLHIAESLEILANDTAAIADMLHQELQERERERNRRVSN